MSAIRAGVLWFFVAFLAVAGAARAFDSELRGAIVDHFQARLDQAQCSRYFRFEGAEVVNWTVDDNRVRAEVVFFVSYVSDQALYRESPLTTYCLGAHRGTGFFEKSKFYRSTPLIYSLSEWRSGWHVDRVDAQP